VTLFFLNPLNSYLGCTQRKAERRNP